MQLIPSHNVAEHAGLEKRGMGRKLPEQALNCEMATMVTECCFLKISHGKQQPTL